MREAVVRLLLSWARQRPTLWRKALSLAVGAPLFLAAVPLTLQSLLEPLLAPLAGLCPRPQEVALGALAIAGGIALLAWSLRVQWRHGGTPAPTAPPQRLITSGPYAHVRNPIQMGASVYCFGLVTVLSCLAVGLAVLLILMGLGAAWHGLVEERELAERFGREYEDYRRRVPAFLPRLRPRR